MKIFFIVTLMMLSACSASLPDLKYADGSNRIPINPKRTPQKRPGLKQEVSPISIMNKPELPVAAQEKLAEEKLTLSTELLPIQVSKKISFTDEHKHGTKHKCPAPNNFVVVPPAEQSIDSKPQQILVLRMSTELRTF